jgi:hypothetical protein
MKNTIRLSSGKIHLTGPRQTSCIIIEAVLSEGKTPVEYVVRRETLNAEDGLDYGSGNYFQARSYPTQFDHLSAALKRAKEEDYMLNEYQVANQELVNRHYFRTIITDAILA